MVPKRDKKRKRRGREKAAVDLEIPWKSHQQQEEAGLATNGRDTTTMSPASSVPLRLKQEEHRSSLFGGQGSFCVP